MKVFIVVLHIGAYDDYRCSIEEVFSTQQGAETYIQDQEVLDEEEKVYQIVEKEVDKK